MKSILKIYWRYVSTACLLVLFVVFINLTACMGYLLYDALNRSEDEQVFLNRGSYQTVADEMIRIKDGYEMSETGMAKLQEIGCAFLMLLDDNGEVVWEWRKPEEMPEKFSAGEIGAFSKWYLKDYPVSVWRYGEGGLLVFGYPKGSVVRYNAYWKRYELDAIFRYLAVFILFNMLVVFVLALLFGFRFYHSLKPVGKGIEELAEGKSVHLREKGITQYLREKINQTSELLEHQQAQLTSRDMARTEWIAGVSHDIRTPLALIAGYADELASDEALSEEIRKKAETIRSQSFSIKKLIADLNLTSKLTYHMQPLRREEYVPAAWLRQTAARMINSKEIPDNCELELAVDDALEQLQLVGDVQLLNRALQNLLGNSVRHNPGGCHIRLSALRTEEGFCFCVRDSGAGVPKRVQRILQEDGRGRKNSDLGSSPSDREPHVMGLRVVKQIACAHGGDLWFEDEGRDVWMSVKDMRQRLVQKG